MLPAFIPPFMAAIPALINKVFNFQSRSTKSVTLIPRDVNPDPQKSNFLQSEEPSMNTQRVFFSLEVKMVLVNRATTQA